MSYPAHHVVDDCTWDMPTANATTRIAEAAANLKNWGQALKAVQQCPSDDYEVELLASVLTVYAEQQHPELKEEVMSNE